MFCTQCGKELPGTVNFCSQCGQETPESLGRRARARKKLYRSRYDRKISGICGGLADYLNSDPTLIRVLAVGSVLFSGGLALVLYVIAWAIIDEEPVILGSASEQAGQQTTS